MTKPLAAARRTALGLMRPAERMPLSEGIEANVWLPPELAAAGGPIRLWKYQRELADALTDPRYRQITCLKASRIGWTSLLVGCVAYNLSVEKSSVIVALDCDDSVRNFMVSQLESTFAASPSL